MNKPKVGQIIYSLNVGNAAHNRKQELTPMTCTKVGTKYFYLTAYPESNNPWEIAFHIKGWREKSDYGINHLLYKNIEDHEKEFETKALYEEIKPFFNHYSGWNMPGALPIESLRKIKEIILSDKQD